MPATHNAASSLRSATKRFDVHSLFSSIQLDTSISSLSNGSTTEQQNLKGNIANDSQEARTLATLETVKAWNSSTKLTEDKSTPVRKRSPLRRSLQVTEQIENFKPLSNGHSVKLDMRRWYGVGNGKPILNRSMDFSFGKESTLRKATTSLVGRSPSRADKAASNSHLLSRLANERLSPKVVSQIYMDFGDKRVSRTDFVDEDNVNTEDMEGSLLCANCPDDNRSDLESSSSRGLSLVSFQTNVLPRAPAIPARFWQDATSMASIRRLKVSGSTRY
ncbi:hypothetical protein GOP47_0013973 [Adiantum capillus-veneris]|uniref:Uncharacterized protein n=1 Tax=Adiantum capillus-veneris TaxID=13818 RepID=A0A9D4ZF25_ADICA|nr:hypothetical protein GOP47_0013973 [Adiantum capillus-veneris]